MTLRKPFIPIILGLIISLLGCTSEPDSATAQQKEPILEPAVSTKVDKTLAEVIGLDVYKSPTCGCCAKWISHMEQNGFAAKTHHPDSMSTLKAKFGLHNHLQSCHTAVSENGYLFEGHVPANIVKQFLNNVPADPVGLAVPAMPVGSPGMEVGDKFNPYTVMLVKQDGSWEPYAEVKTQAEQY